MLAQALRSLHNQTYRDFEIIVVNDDGVDVETIIEKSGQEGRITYIRHEKNRGSAASRNTGLKAARGKYVVYLDDDDVLYPDHLDTLVEFLENSDYKVAYTDACRAVQRKTGGKFEVVGRDVPYSVDFDYDMILVENFVPLLCFMHEKDCLDEAGSFDENLLTFEDWDLWIRMSREFEFAHIKKVTCEFSWRQDGTTKTSRKDIALLREKVGQFIYDKYREYRKSRPRVSETHNAVGVLYFKQGQKNKALTHFQEAVQLDPDNLLAQKNLADTYLELGYAQKALQIYQKILAKNPKDTETLLVTGYLYLLSGRAEEASSYYNRVLEIDPENARAKQRLDFIRKNSQTVSSEESIARK
jgi:glycosyltransferase involved in cell wall biosynthesis